MLTAAAQVKGIRTSQVTAVALLQTMAPSCITFTTIVGPLHPCAFMLWMPHPLSFTVTVLQGALRVASLGMPHTGKVRAQCSSGTPVLPH
jgi:hypothetical protein